MNYRSASMFSILFVVLVLEPMICSAKEPVTDGDGESFFRRARELSSFGEFNSAIAMFDKAIAIKPSAQYYLQRGRCYQNMESYDKAINDFTSSIERNGMDDAPYLHRGQCYQKLNRHKEAIADFTKGVEIEKATLNKSSSLFSLFFCRGRSYELANQFDKALADYDTCMTKYKGGPVDRGTAKMWHDKLLAKMQTKKKKN